jgi:hypothetical protein
MLPKDPFSDASEGARDNPAAVIGSDCSEYVLNRKKPRTMPGLQLAGDQGDQ